MGIHHSVRSGQFWANVAKNSNSVKRTWKYSKFATKTRQIKNFVSDPPPIPLSALAIYSVFDKIHNFQLKTVFWRIWSTWEAENWPNGWENGCPQIWCENFENSYKIHGKWWRRPTGARHLICILYTTDAADERSNWDLMGRRDSKTTKKQLERRQARRSP